MFKKKREIPNGADDKRIMSVVGKDVSIIGKIHGKGGLRIEGSLDGEIIQEGLLVISPTGKVNCQKIQAFNVIIAGTVRGNIVAPKVDIRKSGRVFGNITTQTFVSEDGGYLRGEIRIEENMKLETFGEGEAG